MRVLITGGAGFVGRHFTEYFLKRDDEVWVVDPLIVGTGAKTPKEWYFDPTVYKNFTFMPIDCREFFDSTRGLKFDLVLHLAAIVGGRSTIEDKPIAVADDLSIDSAFWQWAVREKPGKVITFSSSAAYPILFQGRERFNLLKEEMIDFDKNLGMPDMSYGWSKLTCEYLGRLAYKKHGIKSVVYRPFSGYGEDQGDEYPFASILKRVFESEGVVEVWGSGDQKRDFIHIDDCVRGVIETMDKVNDGSAINLSTGIYTSFKMLVLQAASVLGKNISRIVPLGDKPEGVFARGGDTVNQRILGFHYKISLEEGIKRFYESHRHNHNK